MSSDSTNPDKNPPALQELIDTGVYSFLDGFQLDFESWFNGLYRPPVIDSAPSEHIVLDDPLDVPGNLNDLAVLLDRCLLYRREYYDLQQAAVKQAMDYELFQTQYKHLLALELESHIDPRRKTEEKVSAEAADAFKAALPTNTLAGGFQALATGAIAVSKASHKADIARRVEIQAKYEALRVYQEQLQSLHGQHGSSLNFDERQRKIRELCQDDVFAISAKVLSLYYGYPIIYGRSVQNIPPPQTPFEGSFLDALVKWARGMSELAGALEANSAEYEVVIPLRRIPPRSDEEWKNSFRDTGGHYEGYFNIGFHSSGGGVRLKGIAASYVTRAKLEKTELTVLRRRLSLAVTPADPTVIFGYPVPIKGRTVYLPNVAVMDPANPPRYSMPPQIRNLDPRGVWTVSMSKTMGSSDENGVLGGEWDIVRDIHLHLLIAVNGGPDVGGIDPIKDWEQYL